jgi:hypothetical protein
MSEQINKPIIHGAIKCGMVEEVKEIFFLRNLTWFEKQKTSDGVTREFLGVRECLL